MSSKKKHKKQVREMPIRKLNRRHFNIYVGVGTVALLLGMTLVGEFFDRWVFYAALFFMTLAYGVCRFPITRGTRAKDIDGGITDLVSLVLLWGTVATIITALLFVARSIPSSPW
jgi:hypothetical protein